MDFCKWYTHHGWKLGMGHVIALEGMVIEHVPVAKLYETFSDERPITITIAIYKLVAKMNSQ